MTYSPLTLTVISDIHYYSKENGISGKAYEFANSKSQKLLAQSSEVIDSAFEQILNDKRSNIVLISGDITNNGELNSHREIISKLNKLKSEGKKVYVITATHDFSSNGLSEAYQGDKKTTTPAAIRDILFDMYYEFGPDEALSIHKESMSYIVQLCDGYRLFALNDDSNGKGKSGFSDECFEWIKSNAIKAREENQFIIAMTHHPLIAPSPIYELIGKDDMLGEYKKRIEELTDLGFQFIFTGHTHIHNISSYQSQKGNMLYDICCASPIGYPGVMRSIRFNPDDNTVNVSTDYINNPIEFNNKGIDIKNVLEDQLIGVIRNMIDTAGQDIDKLAHLVTAISINPKMIYKYGWIIKPVFKILNKLKLGTVARWTEKETGLKKEEYKNISERKVVDLITELALNLYGGESKYSPETPTYKIIIGFLRIIDSIIHSLHIDFKKIIKVSSSVTDFIRPLIYNSKIDSYSAELKIYPFQKDATGELIEETVYVDTVKESKKGIPIILISAAIVIVFLPFLILLILSVYIYNKFLFHKKTFHKDVK